MVPLFTKSRIFGDPLVSRNSRRIGVLPTLTIRHKRHWFEPRLPHSVFLNGYLVCALI